jgi:hypothetical protein
VWISFNSRGMSGNNTLLTLSSDLQSFVFHTYFSWRLKLWNEEALQFLVLISQFKVHVKFKHVFFFSLFASVMVS